MAKLKKHQQVEVYLNKLMKKDDFSLNDLEVLKYKEISGASELEGIGDRTISNVLNAFKIKKGIKPPQNKMTKKQIVEQYLSALLESGEISQHELFQISYNDLKDVEELAEVGKTTITCTLADFKLKNDKESFEMGVLDFLAQEKTAVAMEEQELVDYVEPAYTEEYTSKNDALLNEDNVQLLKKMINEFEYLKTVDEEKKQYELRELKHALHYVGINPSKIVRLYWEDMSKDFMNRKILSGKAPAPADLRVSGFM